MKFGVVVFPGSNCDHDAYNATAKNLGAQSQFIWHKESTLPNDIDCIILPGGFSYGDYLRCGAIARFSPVMQEVIAFAYKGGLVIGICNGFQILTEAGLLPGTLQRNQNLNFICHDVFLKTMNNSLPFTSLIGQDDILRIPIAHGEGNYFADSETLKRLDAENRVVFMYCNSDGDVVESANPNGSVNNIAGITNETRNVLGMMPHPERYSDDLLGCSDGLSIFKSIENFINNK